MIGKLFSTLAAKIAGGLTVALALALWWGMGQAGRADDLDTKLTTERTQHAVTKASLDELADASERMVANGQKRKAVGLAARAEQQAIAEELSEQIAAIRAARQTEGEPGKTPAAVLNAKGL